jgi:ABC-type transport system substrate-binding protein
MRRLAAAFLLGILLTTCAAPRPALRWALGPGGGRPRMGGHAIFTREEDPDYLDPALSYGTYTAPIIEGVYRGLLEYVDAPGAAGAELIPELATSLPDVREGGTLYAFRVRPDARFGAPLHRHIGAADFKYAIERLWRVNSPGIDFYDGIVGAERLDAGQDTALAGVIAHGDSLYVRIRQPDATFLHVMALPFTCPLPREIVEKYPNQFSQHSVASGPFQVAEYTPRRRVILIRNPDYCGTPAWLDPFEVRLSVASINGVALIRRGLADGGIFEVPAAEFGRLRRDPLWRQQVMVNDALSTWFVFMNTRVPPFNDPRVRQAVAWAIDRRAIAKAWSGAANPAGEILPPSMPGARALGAYQGPDTARARALLREAGYPEGFATTLYSYTTEPQPREATILQQSLADIGIRARIELSEAAGYSAFAGDTTNRVALGVYGWYADYPDPSNFFGPLLDGRRITPIQNNNLSMYENRAIDARIDRARATADPVARAEQWHTIDSLIMRDTPVAPTVHALETRVFSPRLGGWYHHITRLLKIDRLYIKEPLPPPAPVAAGPPPGGARAAGAR